MRQREFSSLGEGNESTRIHHAVWRCNGAMARRSPAPASFHSGLFRRLGVPRAAPLVWRVLGC
jgi:hypothetical protein